MEGLKPVGLTKNEGCPHWWWGEALWVERLKLLGLTKDNEGCPHWWWYMGGGEGPIGACTYAPTLVASASHSWSWLEHVLVWLKLVQIVCTYSGSCSKEHSSPLLTAMACQGKNLKEI